MKFNWIPPNNTEKHCKRCSESKSLDRISQNITSPSSEFILHCRHRVVHVKVAPLFSPQLFPSVDVHAEMQAYRAAVRNYFVWMNASKDLTQWQINRASGSTSGSVRHAASIPQIPVWMAPLQVEYFWNKKNVSINREKVLNQIPLRCLRAKPPF